MKEFTPTDFRNKSAEIYNEVTVKGSALINHRDRPNMIILTVDELDLIKKQERKKQVSA